MAELNFFNNYILKAVTKEIVPKMTFFRDRYFKTQADDVFDADVVLTEYMRSGRRMAAFVAPRVGDIPVTREGYSIHAYKPAYIGVSRDLSSDDLKKRGFGEAFYPGSTKADRAIKLQLRDLNELDELITRREEWMAVQTMINNGCTMQEYLDANTQGEQKIVLFYDGTSNHTYTVSTKWDATGGDFFGDVRAMCKMLSSRGLPAADLILGTDAADAILDIQKVRDVLNKESGITIGGIDQTIEYPGVARMGILNFGGFKLTLWSVDETYEDASGNTTAYFPAKGAMVTAPDCGHMMYGAITQIPHGSEEFESVAAPRVSKLIIKQEQDLRKIRLASRPLAAPKNYCPYIYAENVVN